MLYLDHAASSPEFPEVTACISECARSVYWNPSSGHPGGQEAQRSVRRSFRVLADDLGCAPEQLVMTSCATESVNTAFHNPGSSKRRKRVLYSVVNHAAVLEAGRRMRNEGFDVEELAADPATHGIRDLADQLSEDTAFVSLLGVNNVTGAKADLKAQIQTVRSKAPHAIIHGDLVQMWQKEFLDLGSLDLDFASFSGHKIRGPKGAGLLYVKNPASFRPLIVGGGQQRGLRSGTENPILLAGLAEAVRQWKLRASFTERRKHFLDLRETLYEHMTRYGIAYVRHEAECSSPAITNFSVLGTRGESVMNYLGMKDIYIAYSSACSVGKKDASYVLKALGLKPAEQEASLRLSFGLEHTKEDIVRFVSALDEAVRFFHR